MRSTRPRFRRLLWRAYSLGGLFVALSCSSGSPGSGSPVPRDPAPLPDAPPEDGRSVISIIGVFAFCSCSFGSSPTTLVAMKP